MCTRHEKGSKPIDLGLRALIGWKIEQLFSIFHSYGANFLLWIVVIFTWKWEVNLTWRVRKYFLCSFQWKQRYFSLVSDELALLKIQRVWDNSDLFTVNILISLLPLSSYPVGVVLVSNVLVSFFLFKFKFQMLYPCNSHDTNWLQVISPGDNNNHDDNNFGGETRRCAYRNIRSQRVKAPSSSIRDHYRKMRFPAASIFADRKSCLKVQATVKDRVDLCKIDAWPTWCFSNVLIHHRLRRSRSQIGLNERTCQTVGSIVCKIQRNTHECV